MGKGRAKAERDGVRDEESGWGTGLRKGWNTRERESVGKVD